MLPPVASLQFLAADLFVVPRIPFAIIHYSLNGELPENGLWLDLTQKVFLDHFEQVGLEAAVTAAAPGIVEHLNHVRFESNQASLTTEIGP